MKRTPIKRRQKKDRRTPNEKAYFDWLLSQSCAVSGDFVIERSHIRRSKYGAGMGKKPKDWYCIPLSSELHKEMHRIGHLSWEAKYGTQECYLWKTWVKYGLDKIPDEVRAKAQVLKEP